MVVSQESAPRERTIAFISLLRGTAALLVVYCHLIGGPVEEHKLTWLPYTLVADYLLRPLGITKNFGHFGVVLFFLISGFIISHVAQREARGAFAVKRLLRIYPPYIASVIVTMLLWRCYTALSHHPTPIGNLPFRDVLWSLTLVAEFPHNVINVLAVSWTLTIELTFYLLCLALLPLIRHVPLVAIGTLLTVVGTVETITWQHHAIRALSTIGVIIEYIPMFVCGMVLYFAWAKRITPRQSLIALVAAWVTVVYAVRHSQPFNLAPDDAVLVSFGVALGLFIVCVLSADRISLRFPMTVAADISYSLYLYHLPIGSLVIAILLPVTGFTGAFIAAFIACIGISWLSQRFVEQPFQELARFLLARRSVPKRGRIAFDRTADAQASS